MMFRYALSAILCFSIAFSTAAQRIPPEVTSTRMQASTVQAAVGQPQLNCGFFGAGMHCTDNSAKYNSWKKNQPQIDDYRNSDAGRAGGMSDYEHQTITLRAGGSHASNVAAAPEPIPRSWTVHERTTVYDPFTHQALQVNTGSYNWEDISRDLKRVAPSVLDNFQQKQAAYERVQQIYQQYYEQAAAANAALAQSIRADAANAGAEAAALDRSILPNFAAALSSLPSATLSRDDLVAMKRAREIAQSALSNRSYEMNSSAYAKLERKMRDSLARKDYDSYFAGVEPYTRGVVDGRPAAGSAFKGLINAEGVVNASKLTGGTVSAPFDKRRWLTPLGTGEGEIIRRVANRYQQAYVDSNGLSVLSRNQSAQMRIGELALALADRDLAVGLTERGSSFLALADRMLDTAMGLQAGVVQGVADLAQSIPELGRMVKDGLIHWATEPTETWAAVVELAASLPELRGAIDAAIVSKFESLKRMNDHDRGVAVGHLVFDVATLFIGGGEGALISVTADAGKLGTLATETGAVAVRASAEAAAEAMGRAAAPLAEAVQAMPKAAREGLLALEKTNAPLASALSNAAAQARLAGQSSTAVYLEKMMASGAKYQVEEIGKIASTHEKLMTILKDGPATEFSGTVSRGAREGLITDAATGARRPLVEKDLYDSGLFNSRADHRFSIGGESGDAALYWAVGTQEQTWATIRAEIKAENAQHVIMTTTSLPPMRVLDLTDASVVKMLRNAGVDLNVTTYEYTQAIGNAARANGYDGIVYKSVQTGAKNVVVFK